MEGREVEEEEGDGRVGPAHEAFFCFFPVLSFSVFSSLFLILQNLIIFNSDKL
jgi:hypothetical protein